jgi:FixJ family two-component response regulator
MGYSVLFVDDEENILRALQRDFLYESFECFFVKSGAEALSIMNEKEISVIVADMKMQGMDGLKLLRLVKEKWPLTVRVVISGYLYLPQMLAAINGAYIYQFITKPWGSKREVVDIVNRALDYYKEQKAIQLQHESVLARNVTYQNMIKKINQTSDSLKHGVSLIRSCGVEIINNITYLPQENIENESWVKILINAGELFSDISVLAIPEYILIECNEVLEKIVSGIDSLEGVERVDVEEENQKGDRVRVKDGLIEYCLTKLIDSMLPGIKKYVKIFFKDSEKSSSKTPSKSFNVNFILVISPIHRFEEERAEVKNYMQSLWVEIIKTIVQSFGGRFDLVNQGSKYLLSLELPKQ